MSDSLLSGNISFAGLGNGTDFTTLIEGLMKVEQRRITQLENWRKSWDDKIVQFRELNTKLLSLKTTLEGMNTPGKFLTKNAVSTNEASFTATAGAEAVNGSYSIKVNALAKNSIWTSAPLSSATKDIVKDTNLDGKGSLAFTVAGKTVTTSISAGQNLNDLANAINANTENRYTDVDGVSKQFVRASVVKTTSSPEQYVLQLTALDQGTQFAISNITTSDIAQTTWMSDTVGDPTADIVTSGTGSLSFVVDGKTITANLVDGDSLNDLADTINTEIVNQGLDLNNVRASVVQVQGSPAQYALQVQGISAFYQPSGFVETDLSITLQPGAFTETQVAANAEIEFNGLTLTRSTNAIHDVIPGTTLNLKQVDAAGGTITVSTDKEAVKENVVTFMDAVNEVRTMMMELTKVEDTSSGAAGSILTGNYGLQIIDQRLKNIIAAGGLGFTSYNSTTGLGDYYSSFSQVCILTEASETSLNKGLLVFDEYMRRYESLSDYVTFDIAFDANPEAVANLFAANHTGVTNTSDFSFVSDTNVAKPGTYTVSYAGNGTGVVNDDVTINGTVYKMNADGEVTCNISGKPEYGLVIKINNFAAGAHGSYPADHFGAGSPETPYTVSVQKGKINELIDELAALTDPKSSDDDFEAGPLAVLEDNYNDIIKSIDTKIEYEERRISRLERQYKDRFARLDAMLGYYSGIQTSLQTQIVGMMQQS